MLLNEEHYLRLHVAVFEKGEFLLSIRHSLLLDHLGVFLLLFLQVPLDEVKVSSVENVLFVYKGH